MVALYLSRPESAKSTCAELTGERAMMYWEESLRFKA